MKAVLYGAAALTALALTSTAASAASCPKYLMHAPGRGELATGAHVCVGPNHWTLEHCGAGKVAYLTGATPGASFRPWSCITDPRLRHHRHRHRH